MHSHVYSLQKNLKNLNVVEFKCLFNNLIKVSMFHSRDKVDEQRPNRVIKRVYSNTRLQCLCNIMQPDPQEASVARKSQF